MEKGEIANQFRTFFVLTYYGRRASRAQNLTRNTDFYHSKYIPLIPLYSIISFHVVSKTARPLFLLSNTQYTDQRSGKRGQSERLGTQEER